VNTILDVKVNRSIVIEKLFQSRLRTHLILNYRAEPFMLLYQV